MHTMSLQSGSISPRLLAVGAIVAIAVSLLSILRMSNEPATGASTDLYAGLGGQAAEKTLPLVERGGSVLIIEPKLYGHAAQGMEAMIRAYEKVLGKAGVSVAAREVVMLPGPPDEPREEAWTLPAMREKHPDADLIASFSGLPDMPVKRGERLPLLVFYPEPVDAKSMLRRGEADIVISPLPADAEMSGQTTSEYAILAIDDLQ